MTVNLVDPISQDSWRALRGDRSLRHLSSACLPLRQRAGECTACRAACPADALLMTPEGLALHADCLGCGRCVPACPMGALELPDSVPEIGMDAVTAVRVDCRRVPAALRSDPAVPCLGALDAPALLRLRAQAGERAIELIDRGWCENCPAGGGEHPAVAARASAQALLAEMDVPAELWPRLASIPLPESVALPCGAGLGGPTLSRRAFFGRMAQPVRELAIDAEPASRTRPRQAARARPSVARQRLHAALDTLDAGRRLPASAYPRLTASARCRDHQGCVQVCPTGALYAYREADGGGVRFDAAACIACGLCERHCPEQALKLAPGEAAPTADRSQQPWGADAPLTRHAQRACSTCGTAYGVPHGEADPGLCDPCRKSRHFAQDMFRQCFGAHP